MKPLTSLIFAILLIAAIACGDDKNVINTVNQEEIKYIYEFGGFQDVYEENDITMIKRVIEFSGKFKLYHRLYGSGRVIEDYRFIEETKVSKDFLNSLDSIFIRINFIDYPSTIPWDIDTTVPPMSLSSFETLSWRSDKADTLKKVNINPSNGTGKYPENFKDFDYSLRSLFNN